MRQSCAALSWMTRVVGPVGMSPIGNTNKTIGNPPMQWSLEQDLALLKIERWLDTGTEQVFHFFGYAGVGKTSMAQAIAEGVDGLVLVGAFTGKAAWVLRQKGCDNACTIHSMIYHSRDKSRALLQKLELQLENLIKELQLAGLKDDYIEFDHPWVQDLRRDIKEESNNADQPMFILNRESLVREAELVIIDE